MPEDRLGWIRAVFRDCTLFAQAALSEPPGDGYWEWAARESIRLTDAWRDKPEYPFCCAVAEALLYELARE